MFSSPESFKGVRVLVVEDEALIAEEIKVRLTRSGFDVLEVADTGERAILAAEQLQPELILMDIRLKGQMDGIEAADVIRKRLDTTIVFLTAHSDQDTLRRAKGTEPFGYVLKPFHERELLVALDMAQHRRQLEKQLRESEQKYAATLASIGDGVIATDVEGRITFMNRIAEALTQWPLAEAQGLAVDRVFPVLVEATKTPRENPALQAIRSREVVGLTESVLLMTRSNELVPIDDSAAPINGENGRLLGSVVAFRDLRQHRLSENALKEAEEQLRQVHKMEAIGRLAGGIAHDFNNLLTVINGYSETLLAGHQLDTKSRELVGEIKGAGQRAASLTRQLLAFSRKQVLQPTAIHLGNLVADISRMLQRLLGEDVALTATSVPDLWLVNADSSQIEQVILNLAINSRDAMPKGGRLLIEASNVELTDAMIQMLPGIHPGRFVLLAVSDTGIGMDVATREHVFEPFFTTKEKGKGTGLGLPTVYGIVKQSGGFIYLYSVVGRGTTFKIYFPAMAATTVPASHIGEAGATAFGSETILVVEDDDAVRALTTSLLRGCGYTVHEAGCGNEALRLFAEHADEIDLVATDVVLPGMSGPEIVEKLQGIKPGVRVLFLSGYTDDSVLSHGVLAGEVAFLQKPFSVDSLAKKVRETLDR